MEKVVEKISKRSSAKPIANSMMFRAALQMPLNGIGNMQLSSELHVNHREIF